jgi:hypothetical protein
MRNAAYTHALPPREPWGRGRRGGDRFAEFRAVRRPDEAQRIRAERRPAAIGAGTVDRALHERGG